MRSGAAPDVAELFQKYGAIVYHKALRLLGSHAEAEDAVQEIFIRAMRNLSGLHNQGALGGWLSQITANYCLDILRQRSRHRRLLEKNIEASDEQVQGAATSDLVLLRQLLSEADPQQAQAVIHVYLDDMSHEQAAELLGVSKRSVGNLVERFLTWAQKRTTSSLTKMPAGPRSNVDRSNEDT